MGCGPSRPAQPQHAPPPQPAGGITNVGHPQGGIQMVPRPRNHYTNELVRHQSQEMSREEIHQALSHVAGFLRKHNQNVTMVTVGGAVNAVYLRSRSHTRDVDFFGADINAQQNDLLGRAAQSANSRSRERLGGAWLNNSTKLFMGATLERYLTDQARQMNVVIFSEPGLTVYAAPWSYALLGKLNRLSSEPARIRDHDIPDAVSYLRKWITDRNNGHAVTEGRIRQWGNQYRKECSTQAIRDLRNAYRSRYREDGIVSDRVVS